MRLIHCTLRTWLESISSRGLLTCYATGARDAVWFATPANVYWAVHHVSLKRRTNVKDVVVIEVDVPRSWLTKHKRGIWYSRRDVPPSRFLSIRSATLCV